MFRLTEELRLLQQVWRKALREGEVVIVTRSKSEAARIRFSLYNCLRSVKEGKQVDEELTIAGANCMVQIQPDGLSVRVSQRALDAGLQAVAAALGEEVATAKMPEQVMSSSEVEVAQSLEKVMSLLGEQVPVKPHSALDKYYPIGGGEK